MQANSRPLIPWILVLAAVVFGMVLAGGLQLTTESAGAGAARTVPIPASLPEGGQELAPVPSFADLAEAVLPAVVSVHAVTIAPASENPHGTDFLERFFRNDRRRQPPRQPEEFRSDGGGSGFFISPDGWIVTNYHVIEGATSVTVNLQGREYKAEVKGEDSTTDLALLKVDADTTFAYLELGDSEMLRVGEWVMVIGTPLRLESSVTVGIVSAKGRSGFQLADRSFENFIQTDAAINRGNSGGPLVDTRGRVVGIATAMNFGAENIGFAVPVDTLKQILPQLRQEGRVRRGYLGVTIVNLDYERMRAFGLETTDGALIQAVQAGTPAARAGLEHGDVIRRVDDHVVRRTRDLIDYVSGKPPGATVRVAIIRNGRELTKDVELGERDTQIVAAEREPEPEPASETWLGLEYEDLDDETRRALEVPRDVRGVAVVEVAPSSPLYEEGIAPRDLLVEVNGEPVESAAQLKTILESTESGDYLRFYVSRYRPGRPPNHFFAIVSAP